jgi:hypothetical protein
MKIWRELVRMRVLHPDGVRTLDVMAHSALEARLQASNAWNMTAQEFDACKVMVETAALGSELTAAGGGDKGSERVAAVGI